MQETPESLKKDFKILIYQILARGEKKGHIGSYVDETGSLDDFSYQNFTVGSYGNPIKISDNLFDFFEKLVDETANKVDIGEKGCYIEIKIDAENKMLNIDVNHYVYNERDSSLTFEIDEIKELSPNFESAIDEYKSMGNILKTDYSGGGDSGWIDGDIYNIDDASISERLNNELEELYYRILSMNFGSWGDNEGGHGSIILDLQKNQISVNHTEYYEDSDLESNVIQQKILI